MKGTSFVFICDGVVIVKHSSDLFQYTIYRGYATSSSNNKLYEKTGFNDA